MKYENPIISMNNAEYCRKKLSSYNRSDRSEMEKRKRREVRSEIEKQLEQRLEEAEEFAKQVLDKYGESIKCIVVVGSTARKDFKLKSDIDVFVVLDDTILKITPEIQERIDEDLEKIANKISERFSISTYTLTEFWEYARTCHPIIYNFIKEGIPIYDTGFFGPIKRLLKAGKIPATREAVESYIDEAFKRIMRLKALKLLMLAEDCYHAILKTAQAVLMFMGKAPPVPRKAYCDVKRFLVKPGILEPEYAEWLKDIIEIRKKVEYKEIIDVSGVFIDEWIEKTEKFFGRMFELLTLLEIMKRKETLERTYQTMYKTAIVALKILKKMPERIEELPEIFKREFIDTGLIEGAYWDMWKKIEEMKKMADEDKIMELTDEEVNDAREHVRKLINDLRRVLRKGLA